MNNVERDEMLVALERRVEAVESYAPNTDGALLALEERIYKLESDFASHFHGADELLGLTDPPIVSVEAEPSEPDPTSVELSKSTEDSSSAISESAPESLASSASVEEVPDVRNEDNQSGQ